MDDPPSFPSLPTELWDQILGLVGCTEPKISLKFSLRVKHAATKILAEAGQGLTAVAEIQAEVRKQPDDTQDHVDSPTGALDKHRKSNGFLTIIPTLQAAGVLQWQA
jgi:hypothetical protein